MPPDNENRFDVDLADPTSVAVDCLLYAKAVLALLHPHKGPVSLLGYNHLDGLLHAMRDFSAAGLSLVPVSEPHADNAAGPNYEIPGEILTLAFVKGLVGKLSQLVHTVNANPILLDACQKMAIDANPVTIGNLVSPSAHYAAISFAEHVLLAVDVAVAGGPYIDQSKSGFDASQIQQTHLKGIGELLEEFPTFDSRELNELLARIQQESSQRNITVPPGLEKVWGDLTRTERSLVTNFWVNRREDGLPIADVFLSMEWECSLDPDKILRTHLSKIRRKLETVGLGEPWRRRDKRIYWGADPSTIPQQNTGRIADVGSYRKPTGPRDRRKPRG